VLSNLLVVVGHIQHWSWCRACEEGEWDKTEYSSSSSCE